MSESKDSESKDDVVKDSDEGKDGEEPLSDPDVKVILLGDSAVGKTKMVERYMDDDFNPRQLSTYALTMFRRNVTIDVKGPGGGGEDKGEGKDDDGGGGGGKRTVAVDIWDTAGQERFNKMHPAYYHRAHACILVFDVTRKNTYQHLSDWYEELRESCETIPCILVANKIDVDYNVTKKNFKFAATNNLPFYFVSAADGTNIVKVFEAAISAGLHHKEVGGDDFLAEALRVVDSLGGGDAPDRPASD